MEEGRRRVVELPHGVVWNERKVEGVRERPLLERIGVVARHHLRHLLVAILRHFIRHLNATETLIRAFITSGGSRHGLGWA